MVTITDYKSDSIVDDDNLAPSAFMEMADQIQDNSYGQFVFDRYNAINAWATKPTLGTAGTNTKIGIISFQNAAVPVETFSPVKVPDTFKEDANITLELFAYSTTASNDVMIEISILGVAPTESVDPAPSYIALPAITMPESTSTYVKTTVTLTPAQHGLARGDLLYLTIKREGTAAGDTHTGEYVLVHAVITYAKGELDV